LSGLNFIAKAKQESKSNKTFAHNSRCQAKWNSCFSLGVVLARFQYQITTSQDWQSGSGNASTNANANDKRLTCIRYADKPRHCKTIHKQ